MQGNFIYLYELKQLELKNKRMSIKKNKRNKNYIAPLAVLASIVLLIVVL
ncbi:hypothetical protein ACAG96_06900 [Candidatus Izemoplasma sp. B36]